MTLFILKEFSDLFMNMENLDSNLVKNNIDNFHSLWFNIVTHWPGAPLTRSVSTLMQNFFKSPKISKQLFTNQPW